MKTTRWIPQEDGSLALEAGMGRMRVTPMKSGFCIFRSEIEIMEPMIVDLSDMVFRTVIGTQVNLTGVSSMTFANGQELDTSAGNAALMRVGTPKVHTTQDHAEIIRHVGVSLSLDEVAKWFPNGAPSTAIPFFDPQERDDCGLSMPVTPSVRALALQLSAIEGTSWLDSLREEALAISFFAEVMALFSDERREDAEHASAWERDAIAQAARIIDGAPGQPLDMAALAQGCRMAETRLDQLFRAIMGQTLAEYQRARRLEAAQALLKDTDRPIKQIAFDLGYAHVSNFTRAYQKFFGEGPGRTRTRGRSGE